MGLYVLDHDAYLQIDNDGIVSEHEKSLIVTSVSGTEVWIYIDGLGTGEAFIKADYTLYSYPTGANAAAVKAAIDAKLTIDDLRGGSGGVVNNCTANYIPYSDGTDLQTSELYRVSAAELRIPDVYSIRNVTNSVFFKFKNDANYGDAIQLLAGTSSLQVSDGTGSSINELRWDGSASAIDISASSFYLSHTTLIQLQTAAVNYTYATPNTFAYFDGSGNLVSGSAYGSVITGSGVANYVAYWDGVSSLTGEAGFEYNPTNNTLSVGGTDAMTVNGSAITTRFATHAADGLTEVNAEFHKHGATAASGAITYYARSRGSAGAETIVQNGDTLAYIGVSGYDGTDYALGGYLKWTVDAAPGNNDMPTGFALGLSPDGTQTPVDVFTISSAGVAALSNTLSVVTSVTSPIIIGSTSASGTLTLRATSSGTDGAINFETDPTTQVGTFLSTGEFLTGYSVVTANNEYVGFGKNQNAGTIVMATNSTSGTGGFVEFRLQGAGGLGGVRYNSTAFTTSTYLVADSMTLYANTNASGLDIAIHANAPIRYWTNNTQVGAMLGSGEFIWGSTAVYSSEFALFRKDTNGNTFVRVHNNTSGTAALASMILSNSTANSGSGMWNVSAGYTASGIYQQLSLVVASGSGMTGGINIGTIGNYITSFYTNNTKRAEFSAAGQFTYYTKGTTTSTSNSVTFTSAHYGLEFLWSPTGIATATLPANGAAAGSWFIVTVLTDQTTTISAATADTLITVNDTTADSVAFSTAGQKIGSSVKFISNGSVWIAINLGSTTMTVAT